jgi:Recombination endonuclease VII
VAKSTLAQFFRDIERKYGITENEYRALYYAQGGKCYVCRKASGRARRLGVDHDHLTGEVRGLVCTGSLTAMTCNRLIAIYGRDQLLRAAAMLSDPPPARSVLGPMRKGVVVLPFLVDTPEERVFFTLEEVRGVQL